MAHSHFSRRSPRVVHVLVACAVLAVSLAVASCQQISDPVTDSGGLHGAIDISTCIAACNATARVAIDQQVHSHNIVIYLCKGNTTCIANENARFQAALAQIESKRLQCISDCHHQGGANAGS